MINRESYLKRIRPFMGTDIIKVLTGIRRCGKSVMLELIQEDLLSTGVTKDQFISINFENLKNANLCTASSLHEEILQQTQSFDKKAYLFFDEIQEVQDWEKCINSLRVAIDCDIYITGSNAKLLSGELSSYLAGRYVEFAIYPFSFSEFLELYRSHHPEISVSEGFKIYLKLGGMPYLSNLNYEEAPSKLYLTDIFNSVQLKDIVSRHHIRDVDMMERILTYVILNAGTTFSANSLSKYMKSEHRKISPETILNYLKFGCDAFLFHRLKRMDLQGKEILSTNEKYYIADHGIREALYGRNTRDIQIILENIVYLELLRRGYTIYVGKSAEKEIDFVCEKGSEKCYYQVTYLLALEETIQREFKVYETIPDHYPKYVLSMDELDFSRNGIIHQNIRDFLLRDE